MKHLLSLALATLLTASNFLVAKGAPVESEQEAEISALCEKYFAAYKAKDASAITSLFIGAHPVLMPPNAPAAVGIEAIKSHYQSLFANPRLQAHGPGETGSRWGVTGLFGGSWESSNHRYG